MSNTQNLQNMIMSILKEKKELTVEELEQLIKKKYKVNVNDLELLSVVFELWRKGKVEIEYF